MTRAEVLRRLQSQERKLVALGVRRLAIFGSVARGDNAPESDIDVLVAFEGPTTVDMYFDLKFWLEELLDRPVDLVTEQALRPEMADEVNQEAFHVTP